MGFTCLKLSVSALLQSHGISFLSWECKDSKQQAAAVNTCGTNTPFPKRLQLDNIGGVWHFDI